MITEEQMKERIEKVSGISEKGEEEISCCKCGRTLSNDYDYSETTVDALHAIDPPGTLDRRFLCDRCMDFYAKHFKILLNRICDLL